MSNRRYELAIALLQSQNPQMVAPALPRGPPSKATRQIPMDSRRLTLTSPKAGASFRSSFNPPQGGKLAGLHVFVDTPDSGDYVSLTLQDRVVVDQLLVDLAQRTSYEKKFDEPAQRGDLVTLTYFSAGSTSKKVTWTPTLLQEPIQF